MPTYLDVLQGIALVSFVVLASMRRGRSWMGSYWELGWSILFVAGIIAGIAEGSVRAVLIGSVALTASVFAGWRSWRQGE